MIFRAFSIVFLGLATGVAFLLLLLQPRDSDSWQLTPNGPVSEEEASEIIGEATRIGSAALAVYKAGEQQLVWGDFDKLFDIRSIRKSIANFVIARLVKEGLLSLDTSISELGIDEPEYSLSLTERTATVQQLMESRSGVYIPAAKETRSIERFRPPRGKHAPGEKWFYNNWDFNVLEAVARKANGNTSYCDTLSHYVAPMLPAFTAADRCRLSFNKSGSVYPAHEVRMSARELARIAQVFVHQEMLHSGEFIPKGWANFSAEPVSKVPFPTAIPMHYGRLFWSVDPAGGIAGRSLMAKGSGGQYIWIIPEQQVVIVHLSNTKPLYLRDLLGLLPTDEQSLGLAKTILSAMTNLQE